MSNPQTGNERATEMVDMKLEVVALPVSDVDRAKRFYVGLGWRLDADFAFGDELRVVQLTPPGSPCSIMFGKGFTTVAPGTVQGLFLVVSDVEAARRELIEAGADVSEVFQFKAGLQVVGTSGRVPGPHPERRSYASYASFRDPDGNGWLVQEVKARLPGRGLTLDVESLTELLQEAEAGHGKYEPNAAKHHWSTWYAAYVIARARGRAPDEAAQAGAMHVEAVGR